MTASRFASGSFAPATCFPFTRIAGEGDRVHGMLSALVAAGIEGGYLVNPRLAMVHWKAGDRPLPAQRVTVSGNVVRGTAP